MKTNTIVKDKYTDLHNLLITIFRKTKGVKIEKSRYGDLRIENENSSCDFDRFDFDESCLDHTCSMNELSLVVYTDNLINQTKEELQDLKLKISQANMIKIIREMFKMTLYNTYSKSFITNVTKDSNAHKMLKGLVGWKKVFEYKGNDGIICTYMWKKQ